MTTLSPPQQLALRRFLRGARTCVGLADSLGSGTSTTVGVLVMRGLVETCTVGGEPGLRLTARGEEVARGQ